MGHLIPCSHIAEALKDAGHDVTVITIDNAKGRTGCPNIFDKMGVPYILTEGPQQEIIETTHGMKDAKEVFIQMWEPHCIAAVKQLKPDLVVCDFFSRNGALAADEMGIPSVLNIAFPFEIFTSTGLFKVINIEKATNCCGCLCI